MDIFEIEGPVQLSGSIDVAGSKNSTLPVMAAMLLAPGTSPIPNAPDLSDTRSLETLLESLGATDVRKSATYQEMHKNLTKSCLKGFTE